MISRSGQPIGKHDISIGKVRQIRKKKPSEHFRQAECPSMFPRNRLRAGRKNTIRLN
jgi:hypothetical protein